MKNEEIGHPNPIQERLKKIRIYFKYPPKGGAHNQYQRLRYYLGTIKDWNTFVNCFKECTIWNPPIMYLLDKNYRVQIKYGLEDKFDPYKFSYPRDQWDFENEIGQCCCDWCQPTDEPLDEDCYPYRFCGSGKIVHGPQDRYPEVFSMRGDYDK